VQIDDEPAVGSGIGSKIANLQPVCDSATDLAVEYLEFQSVFNLSFYAESSAQCPSPTFAARVGGFKLTSRRKIAVEAEIEKKKSKPLQMTLLFVLI